MLRTSRTNDAARCPACLHKLDGATDPFGDAAPSPGDLTVCLYCSTVSIFQTDLTLRQARKADYKKMPPDIRAQLRVIGGLVVSFDALNKSESKR